MYWNNAYSNVVYCHLDDFYGKGKSHTRGSDMNYFLYTMPDEEKNILEHIPGYLAVFPVLRSFS